MLQPDLVPRPTCEDFVYFQRLDELASQLVEQLKSLRAQSDTPLANELHKAAALQKLTVIGEAAARLSPAFREAHPQVE
jgi:uncharacterized protein with HEPN domain